MSKILGTSTDYLLDLTDNTTPTDFTSNEKENILIYNYRSLNNDEKIQVEAYIQAMIDIKNSKYIIKSNTILKNFRFKDLKFFVIY